MDPHFKIIGADSCENHLIIWSKNDFQLFDISKLLNQGTNTYHTLPEGAREPQPNIKEIKLSNFK